MRKVIVHPKRKFIIRENTVIGFEDTISLDKLNPDLSFKTTFHDESNISKKEMLDKYRGTGKTRASIPDEGWVMVEVEDDKNLKVIFEEAIKQKKQKNFV